MATGTGQEMADRLTELQQCWDAKFADYRRDDISWQGRCNLEEDMISLEREMRELRYRLRYNT